MNRQIRAWQSPPTPRESGAGLPLFVWLIAGATVLANVGGAGAFGYNASGLAWVTPLAWAALVVVQNPTRVAFPVWTWVLWILAVTLFWYQSHFPALQRTVQLLCPLVIAAAASTYRLGEEHLQRFVRLVKVLAAIQVAIVVIYAGILVTGALPQATGLAQQSITAMFFGCLFATEYAHGKPGALLWWSAMAAIPVVALTRTAIVAIGITLPLTFAPLKTAKRLVFILALVALGSGLFFSTRMQVKMFRSGSGGITDLFEKNLADNGRFFIWEMMKQGVRESPWLGHGAGSGSVFARSLTNGQLAFPHNDWLLTLYDYGVVGTAALVVSLLAACTHATLSARKTRGAARLLFLTGASAFVPFVILMYTDNILVYVSYFGNLQFATLGLAYGALREEPDPGQDPSDG